MNEFTELYATPEAIALINQKKMRVTRFGEVWHIVGPGVDLMVTRHKKLTVGDLRPV